MELWMGYDVEQFSAVAQPFIEADISRNVLGTVTAGVRSGRYREAIFAVVSEADTVVGVALRTPPHNLVAAGAVSEPAAFVQAWAGIDPACPGVSAATPLARALVAAWTEETGVLAELEVAETLHLLGTLLPPDPPVPGELCPADWRERAQLAEWGTRFAVDAGLRHVAAAPTAIESALDDRRLYVWQVDGRSVAMVGHTVTVAGVVRLGPVYTPPPLRGKGYATAATAALSQRLLDRGAERCILYTDAANPISNHVYAKIGYRPIAGWEEHRFLPAGAVAPPARGAERP